MAATTAPLVALGRNVRSHREKLKLTQEAMNEHNAHPSQSALFDKLAVMHRQKLQLWHRCIIRQTQDLAGIRAEVLFYRALRQLCAEPRREHEPQFGIEPNQPAIKRRIMQT